MVRPFKAPFKAPMYIDKHDEIRIFDIHNERFSGLGDELYRSPFYRDYGRLIHSPSFRRLQGKCQLFPGNESDFFRNRLTHSIEVAQIGKAIANRLNWILSGGGQEKGGKGKKPMSRSQIVPYIDTDLVEFAGLAHDLGHPPFGHQGEAALDKLMINHGRFEGNAQTLRLLCRIEKKIKDDQKIPAEPDNNNYYGFSNNGVDRRKGLNPTTRALASILKYDHEIGTGNRSELEKGYYHQEKEIVDQLKRVLGRGKKIGEFKTVEMQIMDFADDIAYSVYDLEDSMKGGFINGLDLKSGHVEIFDEIAVEVSAKLKRTYTRDNLYKITNNIFKDEMPMLKVLESTPYGSELWDQLMDDGMILRNSTNMSYLSYKLQAKNGYYRNYLTSWLVGLFIRSINIEPNESNPAFSRVYIDTKLSMSDHKQKDVDVIINVLKRFTYKLQIESSRLKIVEMRGWDIVDTIFHKLLDCKGEIMPEDYKYIYKHVSNISNETDRELQQYRTICDFIASMTDKYAVEFHGRLKSENPRSIFTFL